jgi:gliding motility-associated-like protein
MKLATKNIWFVLLVLITQQLTYGQQCPVPLFPLDGQTVPVDATISWTSVTGVSAYQIRLGTTAGGSEISPITSTGLDTSYTHAPGLPENSEIFVSVFVFNVSTGNTLCYSYSFFTDSFTSPPPCTQMTFPSNGQQDVSIQTVIGWNYSVTATGYRISLGRVPGGTDIVNNQLVVDELFYDPFADLPPDTEIFVTIIPENRLGQASNCQTYSFTTGPQATIPNCSLIIYPANLEFNVPLSPRIRWSSVPNADGYLVSIGTSPNRNDVLNNADFRGLTETDVINFEPNRQYFIRIVPYNSAGTAQSCIQTSFFTLLGCGPYFDTAGNLVDLTPSLIFPDTFGICDLGDSTVNATANGDNQADGYRWYLIESSGREVLLAEGPEFEIPEDGQYRLEIYDVITGPSGTFECSNSQQFAVTKSGRAVVESTDVELGIGVIDIEVNVSGPGDYEFSLDNPDGPYQSQNRFNGLPLGDYRIFIRDRNGCGITDVLIEPDLTLEGFPKFFTPNGDGINDFWQFIPPVAGGESRLETIFIFDRYGTLLAQIDPGSAGWDGVYQGTALPASDYWFLATTRDQEQLRGHFSLKR